jgi:hypothetical protein
VPPRQQDDGPARAGQQVGGSGIDLAQPPCRRQVRGQHRERPVLAALAGPQRRARLLIGGIHRQVVAAQPFDGEDAALPEQFGGTRQRLTRQRVSCRIE